MENNIKDQPAYYAILTAEVRYDKRLTPNAKLLYAEITALANKKGFCWSSNSYFAELYEVSNTSVSKWISQLVEYGYLTRKLIYKEGSKEILHRYLSLVNDPIEEKLNTPIEEKLKDNTTTINTTTNKKEIEDYSKDLFFEDWNELRIKHLNKKSFLNGMSNYDFSEFKRLKKDYNRERFREALIGLFKQRIFPNENTSMQSNPTHFFKAFNAYLTAYHDRNEGLYGKKSQEI